MSSYNPGQGERFDPGRVQVHRFTEARNMAKDCAARPKPDGSPGSILVSMAGGKKRWAVFVEEGDYISVLLMGTEIMRFYRQWIMFRMGGFNKVTTRSVVNNLLPAGTVTASGDKLFYSVPGTEEPIEVPREELTVRYSGTVVLETTPRATTTRAKKNVRPAKSAKSSSRSSKSKESVAA